MPLSTFMTMYSMRSEMLKLVSEGAERSWAIALPLTEQFREFLSIFRGRDLKIQRYRPTMAQRRPGTLGVTSSAFVDLSGDHSTLFQASDRGTCIVWHRFRKFQKFLAHSNPQTILSSGAGDIRYSFIWVMHGLSTACMPGFGRFTHTSEPYAWVFSHSMCLSTRTSFSATFGGLADVSFFPLG